MSDTLIGALLGVAATLVVGFLANFVSEDYRRFRDAKSLAGALAGELASYDDAWPMHEENLERFRAAFAQGQLINFPRIDRPVDRVFDKMVDKLGLLGHQFAEDVVYVYNNIGAFRVVMQLLSDEGRTIEQQAALVEGGFQALQRARNRGSKLPDRLRRFAQRQYCPFRPIGRETAS